MAEIGIGIALGVVLVLLMLTRDWANAQLKIKDRAGSKAESKLQKLMEFILRVVMPVYSFVIFAAQRVWVAICIVLLGTVFLLISPLIFDYFSGSLNTISHPEQLAFINRAFDEYIYFLKNLWIHISLIVTLFVFIYTQQKTASMSRIMASIPIRFFFYIFIMTSLYALILYCCPRIASRVAYFIYFILLVSTLIFGLVVAINDVVKGVIPREALSLQIRKANYLILSLCAWTFPLQRPVLYSTLLSTVETIYQIFKFTTEKNMDSVYEEYSVQWFVIIQNLHQSRVFDSVQYEILHEKDAERFEMLYRLLLQNQVHLILLLNKNGYVLPSHEAINELFLVSPPDNKRLTDIYLKSVEELLLLLYDTDNKAFNLCCLGLANMITQELREDRKVVLQLFDNVLQRASLDNNLEILTSTVHTLWKCANGPEDLSYSDLAERIRKADTGILQYSSRASLEPDCIRALLNAALKNLELSHYQSAGFLIKFMVTNFRSEVLAKEFDKFFDKVINIERTTTNDKWLNATFGQRTSEYCLKKLTILLYGQQHYVVEKKINFGETPKNFVDINHAKCTYLPYLLENLEASSGAYGLMFLRDKEFMNVLRRNIVLHCSL
ncbi:hypothetical protein [Alicyclobacillus vulcanalis]|uniref:Uncharacterized protein n=1 Tax=Alicyclobacillus vulcanalis TaxID=252246 RepID=A0A1N7PWG6_9BACL|nr:hypothetical protein [Alicyclobacillus vulcanalis]SIT14931.1 hypothetical protein SAMN05421799_1222 [Alicyclobacillus vulcanalis]